MIDAPKLMMLSEAKCQEIWTRIPPRQRRKSCDNIDDLVFRLGRNLYGHPLAGLLWD